MGIAQARGGAAVLFARAVLEVVAQGFAAQRELELGVGPGAQAHAHVEALQAAGRDFARVDEEADERGRFLHHHRVGHVGLARAGHVDAAVELREPGTFIEAFNHARQRRGLVDRHVGGAGIERVGVGVAQPAQRQADVQVLAGRVQAVEHGLLVLDAGHEVAAHGPLVVEQAGVVDAAAQAAAAPPVAPDAGAEPGVARFAAVLGARVVEAQAAGLHRRVGLAGLPRSPVGHDRAAVRRGPGRLGRSAERGGGRDGGRWAGIGLGTAGRDGQRSRQGRHGPRWKQGTRHGAIDEQLVGHRPKAVAGVHQVSADRPTF